MFRRKKSEPPKVQPQLLREMAMRNRITELAEDFDREHAGKVRICCDILAIRDRIAAMEEAQIKQNSAFIAELHFMAKQLDEVAACLQGETDAEPPPLQLTSVISKGGIRPVENGQGPAGDEPRAIDFLRGK